MKSIPVVIREVKIEKYISELISFDNHKKTANIFDFESN